MDFRPFKSLVLSFFILVREYRIWKKLELIKPGILLGNLVSTSGGFFLASRGHVNINLFLKVLLGMACIVSSSCIFNNIIDRDLDKKMNRTKYRILCTSYGHKLLNNLFFLAFFFLILGVLIFYIYVNFLSSIVSAIGVFVYVMMYSFFLKRVTCYSTIVGSIAGSLPPIIGYIAVKNNLNFCCFILFFIFVFWQIVHAYSIILYRLSDYQVINIPTFPILYGLIYTKRCISICIVILFFFNFLLFYFNYMNIFYFFITSIFIFFWFLFSLLESFIFSSLQTWSHFMFIYSLFIIFLISILISLHKLKY